MTAQYPDTEDDVDILARTSDHVPGESAHASALDQHHRDGQLWAAYDPDKARALLEEGPGWECSPERRAWLDGIAYGLEHGAKGLRPRMELEEADMVCTRCAAPYVSNNKRLGLPPVSDPLPPSEDWPHLCGPCLNAEDRAARSFSDIQIDLSNALA